MNHVPNYPYKYAILHRMIDNVTKYIILYKKIEIVEIKIMVAFDIIRSKNILLRSTTF